MKRTLVILSLVAMLTGCIDVIRGSKNMVYIRNDNESTLTYTASPEIVVEADKEYSDAFKTDADVSSNKSNSGDTKTSTTTKEK